MKQDFQILGYSDDQNWTNESDFSNEIDVQIQN